MFGAGVASAYSTYGYGHGHGGKPVLCDDQRSENHNKTTQLGLINLSGQSAATQQICGEEIIAGNHSRADWSILGPVTSGLPLVGGIVVPA
jgi:hypothetical protein